jgi:hypothetical protein
LSSSQPSNGARARYLNGLSAEKQVEVLLKAEHLGPAPTDEADWLVAAAAAEAAERIEAAAARLEAISATGGTDGAIAARLDRIEARLRAPRPSAEPTLSTGSRDMIVAALTIAAMIVVAAVLRLADAPVIALLAAFALGIGGALAYVSVAPMLKRR